MFSDEALASLEQETEKNYSKFRLAKHLAGIIPIGTRATTNYGAPWHESLTLLAPKYTAIHRAVAECARIGCDSIWIVSPFTLQPLVREVVGEFVRERKRISYSLDGSLASHKRATDVPIYYLGMPKEAAYVGEGQGYAILFGARKIDYIVHTTSEYLSPDKFWIAFPHGVYEHRFLDRLQKVVRRTDCNLFLSYDSDTIRDGKPMGFSLKTTDISGLVAYYRKDHFYRNLHSFEYQSRYRLFMRERQKRVTLEDVFKYLTIEPDRDIVLELPWYSQIEKFEGYRQYMSTNAKLLKRDGNVYYVAPKWFRRLEEFSEFLENYDTVERQVEQDVRSSTEV